MQEFAQVFDGVGGCRASSTTRHGPCEMLMIALHCMICGGWTCLTWSLSADRTRRSFCASQIWNMASRATKISCCCSGIPARTALGGRRGSRSVTTADATLGPEAGQDAACACGATAVSVAPTLRARSWLHWKGTRIGLRTPLLRALACWSATRASSDDPACMPETTDPFEHSRCWHSVGSSCASCRGVAHVFAKSCKLMLGRVDLEVAKVAALLANGSYQLMEDCAAGTANRSRQDRFHDGW